MGRMKRAALAALEAGGAAKDAGVRSTMFGVFQDAGYRGLYGGMTYQEIKAKKGIEEKEDLLDCIGRAELAANEFRITQTEEKLRVEKIQGEQLAIEAHKAVGRKVRKAIDEISGTMPELYPRAPSIKKLADRRKRLQDGKNENGQGTIRLDTVKDVELPPKENGGDKGSEET